MTMSVTFHHGSFLAAIATGPATLAELFDMLDMLAGLCVEHGYERALCDLTLVDFQFSADQVDRLESHATAAFAGVGKVASVVPSGNVPETVERPPGPSRLLVRMFGRGREASDWLDPAPAS